MLLICFPLKTEFFLNLPLFVFLFCLPLSTDCLNLWRTLFLFGFYFGAMTLSTLTLNIMTLSITIFRVTTVSITKRNAKFSIGVTQYQVSLCWLLSGCWVPLYWVPSCWLLCFFIYLFIYIFIYLFLYLCYSIDASDKKHFFL